VKSPFKDSIREINLTQTGDGISTVIIGLGPQKLYDGWVKSFKQKTLNGGSTGLYLILRIQPSVIIRWYNWHSIIKLTISLSSGDKDVGVSYKCFLDENHQYYAHEKSQPPNQCVNLHVDNFSSPALKHLLQSQASDESDVDMFIDL